MALIMLMLITLLLKYSAQSRIIITMPDSMIEYVLSLTVCFIFDNMFPFTALGHERRGRLRLYDLLFYLSRLFSICHRLLNGRRWHQHL